MDHHVTRLEAWCSTARQLFNPPQARLASTEYDTLLKYFHAHVLRSLHGLHGVTHVNGQCPLITLPDPILRQILLQVDVLDRCMLAASSKHLRGRCHALAVLRPSLHVQPVYGWKMHVPSTTSLEHAATIALQSLPNDLESVTLTWWPELSIELAQFLSGNMARIQSLRLDFPNTVLQHSEYAGALVALLGTPAPILTDLHLTVDPQEIPGVQSARAFIRSGLGLPFGSPNLDKRFMPDAFDDPLSGQHLSSLLRLRISGMRLPLQNGLVFANVREFCWFQGAPATLDRETLASLVACFPRIETLRLRCAQVSWAPAAFPLRSSLRHVHVNECCEINDLASFLGGTTISLLTITSSSSGKLLEALARESASISFGSSLCELVAKPRSPTASRQLIRYHASIRTIERRSFVFSLRQATCLTLHELFWPRALTYASASAFFPSPLPYVFSPEIFLPALTRLRIALSPCRAHLLRLLDQYEDHSVAGILLGLHGPLSPLRTPALKELEIFYAADTAVVPTPLCCCHAPTLSVSLSDIHRFVASCIRLPAGRRLEHIRINGVEVVDLDPFPYMELLEQLAAVVSISPVPGPNSCDPGTTLCANTYDYIRRDRLPRGLYST